jgi:hypothetical protein
MLEETAVTEGGYFNLQAAPFNRCARRFSNSLVAFVQGRAQFAFFSGKDVIPPNQNLSLKSKTDVSGYFDAVSANFGGDHNSENSM